MALYLGNQIGIIILTAMGPKEEVGYFAAAIRLYDSLTLIPAAIMGAFLPVMSRLFTQSLAAFARTLRFTMKYLFILTAPLVVITVLLAQPIVVLLYREGFASSALALQVLGGAIFFTRGQNLFLSILAGITVYAGALLALKGVTRAEINQLQNMAASDSHVR